MTQSADLEFRVEWEEPGAVRAPELRATWCRLEIWTGPDCVSRVEEVETRAARRSIFVPLYPLAEWIVYNWWSLKEDRRPAVVPLQKWTYSTLVRTRAPTDGWLRSHNLRGVGEGFPWPDLTVVPEGGRTRVVWRAAAGVPRGGLRYLSSGEVLLPSDVVQRSLTSVVELALTRLDELDIKNTRLQAEWEELQRLDADELAYCEAAARLGLDPFQLETPTADLLELAGRRLGGDLLGDFLDAVDPARLRESLDWVTRAVDEIQRLQSPDEADLAMLQAAVRLSDRPVDESPWEQGYREARAVRFELGLADSERYDVGRFVISRHQALAGRALDGCGSTDGGIRVVYSRGTAARGTRFNSARALWHGVTDSADSSFLLTQARTIRQKTERAFAAEVLAPAAGIGASLAQLGGRPDAQDVEEIADRYDVGPLLVERQIDNQLDL